MTLSHEIRVGDCLDALRAMPDQSFHCCITSPPYFGLRDYGMASQIGLEQTPAEFVARLVEVFREVRRVLRDDGTLWVNMGDSYASIAGGYAPEGSAGKHDIVSRNTRGAVRRGHRRNPAEGLKQKDLMGIPWRLAFALQDDGWYLRQDIIWHKPNPMPESVRDRCTRAHEYVFMLTKAPRYYYDHEAVKEDAVSEHPSGNGFKRDARESYKNLDGTARGNDEQWTGVGGKRNRRSVWTVPTAGFKGAHFATFPPDLIRPCVLAGAPRGGLVLDPFGGAGTTALVAMQEGRRSVLIELNPEYAAIARNRLDTAWLEGAAQLDLLHDQKESVA
ncbi:site-specific DNA-methyltransferase [Pseudomonas aeruginosa]|nr:site-specific DNA-methyltransferase [Pseudomonas aeruginosa]MBG4377393.1 site-specific DNA-methyltransferase [Pseudomonas aeruginosa]NQC42275.1 site-specific DNA-methyltransferase [Pseudomonas aeruginosa]